MTSASPAAVLIVVGDLDIGTVDQFRTRALSTLASHPSRLVMDLSDVGFIDAAGLGTLVRISVAARRIGCSVRIRTSRSVRRLLVMTDLDFDLAA